MTTEKPLSEKIWRKHYHKFKVSYPNSFFNPKEDYKQTDMLTLKDVAEAVERLKGKLKLLKYLEEEDIDEIFGDLK